MLEYINTCIIVLSFKQKNKNWSKASLSKKYQIVYHYVVC